MVIFGATRKHLSQGRAGVALTLEFDMRTRRRLQNRLNPFAADDVEQHERWAGPPLGSPLQLRHVADLRLSLAYMHLLTQPPDTLAGDGSVTTLARMVRGSRAAVGNRGGLRARHVALPCRTSRKEGASRPGSRANSSSSVTSLRAQRGGIATPGSDGARACCAWPNRAVSSERVG